MKFLRARYDFRIRLRLKNAQGDGNCLYYCFAFQFPEGTAQMYRALVVNSIRTRGVRELPKLAPAFEQAVEAIAQEMN
uniref:OTU domain-containing protein n=1 Tax=Chromera velia CCMP2878 TaxID=1169474 RepID=A0A0G4FNK6_9ALVE|eukprot:Cvel_17738.t1-p1 / transcript=Cvel_17738.t1 / gene=Cvel_17738 / organism=Chromera_velia_CCMP2878 / gene_product=hypothetical protein / transcript_product=hypothetical protein / location=Cvel_scaffold1433:22583-22813(+) / protein_length=77 / sequence_SO=supercontig / SO=protein_coding / is_pseudo=false